MTTRATHTPGPWIIDERITQYRGPNRHTPAPDFSVIGSDRSAVCRMFVRADAANVAQVRADVALIAAAPDLLDALTGLLERFSATFDNSNQADVDAYYAAKAAIAKAEAVR